MSLLGELQPSSGLCNVSGKVSYVPQEAWVFQGTIRENILFGDEFNNDEYWNTVKACSLDKVSTTEHIFSKTFTGHFEFNEQPS